MAASASSSSFSAVVFGATGAVGRAVVADLVRSAQCQEVTAVSRRELPRETWQQTFPGLASVDPARVDGKLKVAVVDFERLEETLDAGVLRQASFACCGLGSTRAEAGGAEGFRHSDLEIPREIVRLCAAARIPAFSLVSSYGADRNSWFLYMQVKGQLEHEVREARFPRTAIYQPGLLDRGERVRTAEKIYRWFTSAIGADTVGRAIVAQFLQQLPTLGEGAANGASAEAREALWEAAENATTFGNAGIERLATMFVDPTAEPDEGEGEGADKGQSEDQGAEDKESAQGEK